MFLYIPLGIVGGLATFLAVWPFYGLAAALIAAPLGGSFLAFGLCFLRWPNRAAALAKENKDSRLSWPKVPGDV